MRNTAKLLTALMIVCVVCPAHVSADWRAFIPRPLENHADLNVFASYESDDNRSNGRGQQWHDTFIKEKLTLYSYGYSYDPRFISYWLTLSGALKQEEYKSSAVPSEGWTFKDSIEYNAVVIVLPEHPYNLRLFAIRTQPLYMEQSATQTDNVETSRGAIFRYRKKPYFLNLKYIETTHDSLQVSTDIKTFNANAMYYKLFSNNNVLTLGGDYNHQKFSSTAQLEGESDLFNVNSYIKFYNASLYSTLTKSTYSQTSATPAFYENDQLNWDERLTADLPLNFKTILYYSYSKNTAETRTTETSRDISLSDTRNQFEFHLIHNVYESLTNEYVFRRNSVDSLTGSTVDITNSLTMNYDKKIPWGMLMAGLSLSRSETDSTGLTTVVNESHPSVPVPGFFLINVQTIVPATLSVFVRSALPPFDLILLEQNIHYTVTPLGTGLQVNVISLPPQFAVPGTYDFLVSYDLAAGDFKLRIDTFGFNLSLNLFNNMLIPYYSYLATRAEVLSGFFPGIAPDSNLNTLGVTFQKGSYRLLAEYQRFDSNINPYRQWRGEASYTSSISERTNVYASVLYTNTEYIGGTSFQPGPGYTNQYLTFSGNIQHQLKGRVLYLTAGGSYSIQRGTTDGESYSVNASLNWNVGKFTMSFGASVAGSTAEPGDPVFTASTIKTERFHQYYYANITRQLF